MATLLIMAAGLGSRYGGNKQIDGLGPCGEMLMQYSIYDALRAGFDQLVFVIKAEHRPVIEEICKGLAGVQVDFVCQDYSSLPSDFSVPQGREKPYGTVHAVLCARNVIREPFAVINADDFYGADAFLVMAEQLRSLSEGHAAMVAYRLKNTVSRNGAVTRGICRVQDGKLCGVRETYQITVDDAGVIRDAEAGMLAADARVSMNLWGFSPDFFGAMQEEFDAFLHAEEGDALKKEFALPTLVDRQIRAGALQVRVADTDAVWFGVTYREDREAVRQALSEMQRRGVYPKKLW